MSIGTLLLDRGLVTRPQLDQALAAQRASGERLDRALIRLGFITREGVLGALGDQFHLPVIDLGSAVVPADVLGLLPAKLVYKQHCVPVGRQDGALTIATSDPFEISVLDELRLLTGCSINLVLADEDDLHKFIRAHYGVGGDTLDAMAAGLADKPRPAAEPASSELDQAQEASVIRLVNDLLIEAIKERATDVHIEPYEHDLAVRYRIDGVLQRASVPPTITRFGPAIVSRLKIMANLNIAEKRLPQDGRITLKQRNPAGAIEEFDLRVSVIPMLFGEGVVLRILSTSAVLLGLGELGMPAGVREHWEKLIQRPHGILLVTGPTGSGKSTTLYASLHTIASDEVKLITVEDPVEYHIPGVNQIQVNPKVGLTFAAGLRSVLRHDPDVVMIGEIRDKETAEVAVQASLTGHLVFSTLHTNDAAGATTRLLDMGVEPFLVASSVEAVLAQRLVRRICPACRVEYKPEPGSLPAGFKPTGKLARGAGCKECRGTGYRGRLGIYELLRMSDSTRARIMARESAPVIAAAAGKAGELSTLRQDGYEKVSAGITTVDEVLAALAE